MARTAPLSHPAPWEMNDFAKIVRAADGAQVLFFKNTDTDSGKPQLRQVTEYEGLFAELNMSFTDDDEGWDKLDKCFDAADEAQANGVRAAISKVLSGAE